MENNRTQKHTERVGASTNTTLAKSDNTWLNKYRNFIFLGVCGIMVLPVFFHQSKQPDYNYGNYTEWQAYDNLPVILEIRKEERCGTVHLSGCTKYNVAQLYLHISLPNRQEVFRCWFSSNDDSKYFFTDNLGYRRYNGKNLATTLWGAFETKGAKIEIDKVTYAVARGEKAISKNGLRYCSIKDIKFKHFSDVEYLALQVTQSKELYPEYLEMYKEYFY